MGFTGYINCLSSGRIYTSSTRADADPNSYAVNLSVNERLALLACLKYASLNPCYICEYLETKSECAN